MTVESEETLRLRKIGKLKTGDYSRRYISSARGLQSYPYPVGYEVSRRYGGHEFLLSVQEGGMGPAFKVECQDGFVCEAGTPERAWAEILRKKHVNFLSCVMKLKKLTGSESTSIHEKLLAMMNGNDGNSVNEIQQQDNQDNFSALISDFDLEDEAGVPRTSTEPYLAYGFKGPKAVKRPSDDILKGKVEDKSSKEIGRASGKPPKPRKRKVEECKEDWMPILPVKKQAVSEKVKKWTSRNISAAFSQLVDCLSKLEVSLSLGSQDREEFLKWASLNPLFPKLVPEDVKSMKFRGLDVIFDSDEINLGNIPTSNMEENKEILSLEEKVYLEINQAEIVHFTLEKWGTRKPRNSRNWKREKILKVSERSLKVDSVGEDTETEGPSQLRTTPTSQKIKIRRRSDSSSKNEGKSPKVFKPLSLGKVIQPRTCLSQDSVFGNDEELKVSAEDKHSFDLGILRERNSVKKSTEEKIMGEKTDNSVSKIFTKENKENIVGNSNLLESPKYLPLPLTKREVVSSQELGKEFRDGHSTKRSGKKSRGGKGSLEKIELRKSVGKEGKNYRPLLLGKVNSERVSFRVQMGSKSRADDDLTKKGGRNFKEGFKLSGKEILTKDSVQVSRSCREEEEEERQAMNKEDHKMATRITREGRNFSQSEMKTMAEPLPLGNGVSVIGAVGVRQPWPVLALFLDKSPKNSSILVAICGEKEEKERHILVYQFSSENGGTITLRTQIKVWKEGKITEKEGIAVDFEFLRVILAGGFRPVENFSEASLEKQSLDCGVWVVDLLTNERMPHAIKIEHDEEITSVAVGKNLRFGGTTFVIGGSKGHLEKVFISRDWRETPEESTLQRAFEEPFSGILLVRSDNNFNVVPERDSGSGFGLALGASFLGTIGFWDVDEMILLRKFQLAEIPANVNSVVPLTVFHGENFGREAVGIWLNFEGKDGGRECHTAIASLVSNKIVIGTYSHNFGTKIRGLDGQWAISTSTGGDLFFWDWMKGSHIQSFNIQKALLSPESTVVKAGNVFCVEDKGDLVFVEIAEDKNISSTRSLLNT